MRKIIRKRVVPPALDTNQPKRYSFAYNNYCRLPQVTSLPWPLNSRVENLLSTSISRQKLKTHVAQLRLSLRSMVFHSNSFVKGQLQLQSEIDRQIKVRRRITEEETYKRMLASEADNHNILQTVFAAANASSARNAGGPLHEAIGEPSDLLTNDQVINSKLPEMRRVWTKDQLQKRSSILSGLKAAAKETSEKRIRKLSRRMSNPRYLKSSRFVHENDFIPMLLEYDKNASLAYVAHQMSFTHSPLYKILREIRNRTSNNWRPKTVFDFGCGPGIGLWTTWQVFMDEMTKMSKMEGKGESDEGFSLDPIQLMHGVDKSDEMLKIADSLIKSKVGGDLKLAENVTLKSYMPVAINQYTGKPREPYDLVICNNVLSEQADEQSRSSIIDELWSLTGEFLVIIERGNPTGFDSIIQARSRLITGIDKIASDAHIFAPCPHEKECPMKRLRFCSFPTKVSLWSSQMEICGWKSNPQHSKYSYLVIRRGERPKNPLEETANPKKLFNSSTNPKELEDASLYWDRICRPPLNRKGHAMIDCCSVDGLIERKVARGGSTSVGGLKITRDARCSSPGELFPHQMGKIRVIERWK